MFLGLQYHSCIQNFWKKIKHYQSISTWFIADLVDSSGIRLWITPNLRRYDTGIMQIGAAIGPDFQIVPPGQQNWTTHGYCTSSCLSEVSYDNEQTRF